MKIDVLYKPGRYLPGKKLSSLAGHLRECAGTCFEEVPDYQVMRGTREELVDKIIAVAWDREKKRVEGFCSTVLLPVEGVGDVLHLGLTCVRPEARSRGLTHLLASRAVSAHLVRTKPIMGKLWISNCAAVLSSLVNVAIFFEHVYPSPFTRSEASGTHRRIAKAIDRYYRDSMYIDREAVFDEDNFVFRRSVKDTVFQKNENDARFHHRNVVLNEYYKKLLNFEEGDEALQIGYASTFTAVKHVLRLKDREISPDFLGKIKEADNERMEG